MFSKEQQELKELLDTVVGNTYQHYKNGKYYFVTGIQWDSSVDEWAIAHMDSSGNKFTRPWPNFLEIIEGDILRFTECKVYTITEAPSK